MAGAVGNSERQLFLKTPAYGIRALAILLKNYYEKYGLDTVTKIIKRYAPHTENDTDAYIESVSRALGVLPKRRINPTEPEVMLKLIKAIILHENGSQPYNEEILIKGLEMAGIK